MIIGLCGKSGSGKSTIARAIAETRPDAVHCDIDKIGHQVMTIKEVQEEAIKCFGEQIVTGGNIDRKKLGELVFTSREKMKELTDITWKHMQALINRIIQDNKDKVIILDYILLSQTHYFDMCDIKVLVDVPYEIRKMRVVKRDGITEEAFDIREKGSIEYDIDKFDIITSNNDINEIRKLAKKI